MRKKNYVIKYDRVFFENKWKEPHRSNSGLKFGIMEWWSGPCDFCYKFSIFGFEMSIWFKRIFNEV